MVCGNSSPNATFRQTTLVRDAPGHRHVSGEQLTIARASGHSMRRLPQHSWKAVEQ
jgi:hypothetical protein